ncbi:hypothetical protein DNTS_016181, partial [Danionella cerebrum]
LLELFRKTDFNKESTQNFWNLSVFTRLEQVQQRGTHCCVDTSNSVSVNAMSGRWCRSLNAFTGVAHVHSLRFNAGERILITRAVEEDGWWEGERDGERGWFPSSYVRIEEEEEEVLPCHWRSLVSPEGRTYFHNTLTHETSWNKPSRVSRSSRPISSAVNHSSATDPGEVLDGDCCVELQSEPAAVQKLRASSDLQPLIHFSYHFCSSSAPHSAAFPTEPDFTLCFLPQRALPSTPGWKQEPSATVMVSDVLLTRESPCTEIEAVAECLRFFPLWEKHNVLLKNAAERSRALGYQSGYCHRGQASVYVHVINCVTFPELATDQQLLKPDEWSYCDYFWVRDGDRERAVQQRGCAPMNFCYVSPVHQADRSATVSGFDVLLQKQMKGKQMQKEMASFMRERIRIEEEYSRSLNKLSQSALAAQEDGTLGAAWAQLRKSLAEEADVHHRFSSKLHGEVEKPLEGFRGNFKKDLKRYEHQMADLRRNLSCNVSAVLKASHSLSERQKDLELKTRRMEMKLCSKTEEDMKRAQIRSTQAGEELKRCVHLYNQSQSAWFEEMVTSSLELERLEEQRVEVIRQHLHQYTTLRHETDMFNQSSVEAVDKLLRSINPTKDRETWVQEQKTGEIRPTDMKI